MGEVRTREARAKAKALLGLIGKGVDPRPQGAGEGEAPNLATGRSEGYRDIDLTLRAAWTRYRDPHLIGLVGGNGAEIGAAQSSIKVRGGREIALQMRQINQANQSKLHLGRIRPSLRPRA